jgi:hypothetical protein
VVEVEVVDVVVGGAVVVLVVEVVDVVVDVVDVVDVVVNGGQGRDCVIELAQGPVEVTVTEVVASFTLTIRPFNNWVLVAVEGVTAPASEVRLKLGPRLLPNPLPNINSTFLATFI